MTLLIALLYGELCVASPSDPQSANLEELQSCGWVELEECSVELKYTLGHRETIRQIYSRFSHGSAHNQFLEALSSSWKLLPR